MTPVDTLQVRWTITDPDARLGTLKQHALVDLAHGMAAQGLHVAGHIRWAITHGTTPTLTATIPVTATAGRDERNI